MKPDRRVDTLVDALRADLPSDPDARRVRARLAAAGVAVGTGFASQAAAGSAVATKGLLSSVWSGLSAQLGALSLVSKVGLATIVSICALSVPLVLSRRSPASDTARAAVAVRARLPRNRAADVAQPAPASALAVPLPTPLHVDSQLKRVIDTPARSGGNAGARPRGARAADAVANGAERSVAVHAVSELGPPPTAAWPPLPLEAAPNASNERITTGTESPLPPSTLGEETALIDAAFTALRARDFGAAAGFIAEHERRFPRGLLSRERERARRRLETLGARN
jgi:hypothetical protein